MSKETRLCVSVTNKSNSLDVLFDGVLNHHTLLVGKSEKNLGQLVLKLIPCNTYRTETR